MFGSEYEALIKMAKRSAQTSSVEDPLKALEDALRLDLERDDDADSSDEQSFEELEAQVESAAAELAKSDSETARTASMNKRATPGRIANRPQPSRPSPESKISAEPVRSARPQTKQQVRPQPQPQPQPRPQQAPKAVARPVQQSFAPANDDSRESRAAIMRTLDGKGGRSTRIATYILSAAWVLGGLIFTNLIYGSRIWEIDSFADLAINPEYLTALLAIVLPVLIFLAFGLMIARAQEMRAVAKSMAELAIRLFEPETMATDNIMRVGQAVRREVSAINEGIERTIARASELETLVHSEINALEHSYSDNEVRLRSLVEGLSNEREAIVVHSERVRASIVSAHEQLREELETAGDEITNRLSTSGKAVAELLDTRTTRLSGQAEDLTQSVSDLLQKRTEALMLSFGNSGRALAKEFDSRLEALQDTLSEHGQSLLGEFETRASSLDNNTKKLNTILNERARQLNETLVTRTREINESLSIGEQALSGGLDNVIESLNAKLDEKSVNFRQSLQHYTEDAMSDLDVRSGFFEERLQSTISQLNTAFDERVLEFSTTFDERSGTLSAKLSENLDSINSTLVGGTGSIEGILKSNAGRISQTLSERTQSSRNWKPRSAQ